MSNRRNTCGSNTYERNTYRTISNTANRNQHKRICKQNNKPIISLAITFVIAFMFVVGMKFVNVNANKADMSSLERQYIVVEIKAGDTISSIAAEHIGIGYSDIYEYVDDIMKVNGIKTDDICAGDNIILPVYVAIEEAE